MQEAFVLYSVIYRRYKSHMQTAGVIKGIQENFFANVSFPKILDFVSPSIFVYTQPYGLYFRTGERKIAKKHNLRKRRVQRNRSHIRVKKALFYFLY